MVEPRTARAAMTHAPGHVVPCHEVKFTSLDLKAVEVDGSFEGYASLFHKEDMSRDVVLPGAFAESLAQRGPAGGKMLFQHDANQPIGVWSALKEDARGLYAQGRLMHTFQGLGLKPLSPVHVRAVRADGDVTISWVRRTRTGGDSWEAPEVGLGEDAESYEVDILDGEAVVRTLASTSPAVTYTAAQQTVDFGSPQPSYDVRIHQMSASYGRGTPRSAVV